jgi:hypothetical protein
MSETKDQIIEAYQRALNRLNHWGMLLTGRIAGTLRADDPRSKGYRDLFQKFLIQRAEVNAITAILLEKGITTREDLTKRITDEATHLDQLHEQQYPGVRSTDSGLDFYDLPKVQTWMKGWPQ